MVSLSRVVISALRLGRLAKSRAERSSVVSRWRCKSWNVLTELRRLSRISPRTCWLTRLRTVRSVPPVRPTVIASSEKRNLVRNRNRRIVWPLAVSFYTNHGHWRTTSAHAKE